MLIQGSELQNKLLLVKKKRYRFIIIFSVQEACFQLLSIHALTLFCSSLVKVIVKVFAFHVIFITGRVEGSIR